MEASTEYGRWWKIQLMEVLEAYTYTSSGNSHLPLSTSIASTISHGSFYGSSSKSILRSNSVAEPVNTYAKHNRQMYLLFSARMLPLRRRSPPRAVAVKSIRLGVGLGGNDYDLGELKVLHLVRDPRGVVRSQREHFGLSWGASADADSTAIAHAGGVR